MYCSSTNIRNFASGIGLCVVLTLVGCSDTQHNHVIPPNIVSKDTVDKYLAGRESAGIENDIVEFCNNGIVKVNIFSRGKRTARSVYLPRNAVLNLRDRDSLNSYPLDITIAEDCLFSQEPNCSETSKGLGISVSLEDSASRVLKTHQDSFNMVIDHRMDNDLMVFVKDPEWIKEQEEDRKLRDSLRSSKKGIRVYESWEGKVGDKVYTNFLEPNSDDANQIQIVISYASNKLFAAHRKRCSWSFYSTIGLKTSRASHCDDLGKWKLYNDDFEKVVNKIGSKGEFVNECEL